MAPRADMLRNDAGLNLHNLLLLHTPRASAGSFSARRLTHITHCVLWIVIAHALVCFGCPARHTFRWLHAQVPLHTYTNTPSKRNQNIQHA